MAGCPSACSSIASQQESRPSGPERGKGRTAEGKGQSPAQPSAPTLGGCHLQVPKSCFFAPSYPILPHERNFCFIFLTPLHSLWDLSSQPGIKVRPPAVEAQYPNHWTTRESPWKGSFKIRMSPTSPSSLGHSDLCILPSRP